MTDARIANPVVVCGPPRSGTTFLTALLNGHPDFLITNESRLFSAPLHISKSVTMGILSQTTGPLALEFVRQIENAAAADFTAIYSRVRKVAFTFQDKEMMTVRVTNEAPKYIGDKYPGYSADEYSISEVNRLVPNAKWLFIIRQIGNTI